MGPYGRDVGRRPAVDPQRRPATMPVRVRDWPQSGPAEHLRLVVAMTISIIAHPWNPRDGYQKADLPPLSSLSGSRSPPSSATNAGFAITAPATQTASSAESAFTRFERPGDTRSGSERNPERVERTATPVRMDQDRRRDPRQPRRILQNESKTQHASPPLAGGRLIRRSDGQHELAGGAVRLALLVRAGRIRQRERGRDQRP
jgi:hypothetical protein